MKWSAKKYAAEEKKEKKEKELEEKPPRARKDVLAEFR
jgi:hypothetical protein